MPSKVLRLFFALAPDAAAHARIAQLQCELAAAHALASDPVPASKLHATLHFLGTFNQRPLKTIEDATAAAGRLAQAPFDVSFDAVGSLNGQDSKFPLVLRARPGSTGTLALRAFHSGMRTALDGIARPSKRRYEPHVTLFYDPHKAPVQPVEPIAWRVDSFFLMLSFGGDYEMLGTWPLAG